jgi:hypothetical protein
VTRFAAGAALAVLLGALAAGWIGYARLWRYGDARRISYRDASASIRGFETAHALSRIYRSRGGRDLFVLIASGPRSSSGYRLDIVRAVEERSRVVVVVKERAPTLAHPGRPGVTYPYRLVVLPNLHKPVTIHWEGRP